MISFKQYLLESLVFGYHGRPTDFNPNVDPQTYRTYSGPVRHHFGSGFYQSSNPELSSDYARSPGKPLDWKEKSRLYQSFNPQLLQTPMDSVKIAHVFDDLYYKNYEKFMSDLEKTRLSGFNLSPRGTMEPWRHPPGAGYKTDETIFNLTRSGWHATPETIPQGKALRSAKNQYIRRLADSGYQALSADKRFYDTDKLPIPQSVTPGAMQRNIKPTIIKGPDTGKTISLMSKRPETSAEKLAKETGAKLRDTIYLPHVEDTPKPPTPSSIEDEFNRELRSAERRIKYVEKPVRAIKGVVKGLGVAGAVADPAGTAFQAAADAAGGRLAGAFGGGLGAALFINQSAGDPEGDIVANMTPEQTKEYNERKRQEMLARQEQERRQKEIDRMDAPTRNPQMGGPVNKPKM